MRHPNPEELEPLLGAVDVATWAVAVKANTKRGHRCPVDVTGALQDLLEAWYMFKLVCDDRVAVLSDAKEGDAG